MAFAAHALVTCLVTISQFVPGLWGFDKKGRKGPGARVSTGILGIIVGSFLGVGVVAIIVGARHDPDPQTGWASIDVVRIPIPISRMPTDSFGVLDLRYILRETINHPRQVHASSPDELPQQVNARLVNTSDSSRLCWWTTIHLAVGHR